MSHAKDPDNDLANAFLKAFEDTGNVRLAAKRSKFSKTAHYRWLKGSEKYAAAFAQRRIRAGDFIESVAVERATTGWKDPVYYQGAVCGHVTRYSDYLLMQLLRGLKPDVYGVNRTEISGPGKTPVQARIEIEFVNPPDEVPLP